MIKGEIDKKDYCFHIADYFELSLLWLIVSMVRHQMHEMR